MALALHTLNPHQRQAVQHLNGPLLILAGAGSGKTRVITFRIAYMLERGISPGHILAMSFTNKAAAEMRERVAHLVTRKEAERLYLSTFHSLGLDILHEDIDVLGYKKPFTILDQSDQLNIVKDAMKELGLDPKMVEPRNVLFLISRAKMAFTTPLGVEELRHHPLLQFGERIFPYYQSALRGRNAVDFDDLICLPVQLFKQDEQVRLKYAERFQYVMVDEYQDTNHTQLMFVQELVKDHHNICVVGDDDQSIYAFRGAVAQNILDFEHMFPGTRTIKLEQNYRSTNTILKAANRVIAHNVDRKGKTLWSSNGDGQPLLWVACQTEREEAEFVAGEILRMHTLEERPYTDFAILYRVNPQAAPFEETLAAHKIPYTVVGATELFDRKDVKDFLGYLSVCVNARDENSLRRIVNVPPRGIGPTLLERLGDFAREQKLTFFEAICRVADDPKLIQGAGHLVAENLHKFVDTLLHFNERFGRAQEQGESLAEVGRALLKRIQLIEHIQNVEKSPRAAKFRIENVERVLGSIARFQEAGNNQLALLLGRLMLDQNSAEDNEDNKGVILMTLHSSKGLEFPVTFMVGMENGYLPHQRSMGEEGGESEERRLCYVGITRAREKLVFTSAAQRRRYGSLETREPSMFLDEIPSELLRKVHAGDQTSVQDEKARREARMAQLRATIFKDG